MQIDITQIVVALVGVLATIVTGYLIPYIRSKTSSDVQAEINYWATVAVNAAEQKYSAPKSGEKKKEYVLEFLKAKGFKIDLNSLDNVIESAVLQLKQSLSD